jgi:hypothetical protein
MQQDPGELSLLDLRASPLDDAKLEVDGHHQTDDHHADQDHRQEDFQERETREAFWTAKSGKLASS